MAGASGIPLPFNSNEFAQQKKLALAAVQPFLDRDRTTWTIDEIKTFRNAGDKLNVATGGNYTTLADSLKLHDSAVSKYFSKPSSKANSDAIDRKLMEMFRAQKTAVFHFKTIQENVNDDGQIEGYQSGKE